MHNSIVKCRHNSIAPVPTQPKQLAQALEVLHRVDRNGIVRAKDLPRTIRERLLKAGFVAPIIKGWYCQSNPGARPGHTAWLPYYWEFVSQYLHSRFKAHYCLSAEASLQIHSGSSLIPKQLTVMCAASSSKLLRLPGEVSLLVYTDKPNLPKNTTEVHGLRLMKLEQALTRVAPAFFRNYPTEASVALQSITDPSAILAELLEKGSVVVAGRLAGAFRANHQPDIAHEIIATMRQAGDNVREINPFEQLIPEIARTRSESPYSARIRTMWANMRDPIIETFPRSPGLPANPEPYLRRLDDAYVNDAYNSLSIEGYRVSPELIEQVRTGNWNPDVYAQDRETRDVLAARGYYECFHSVRSVVAGLLTGAPISSIRSAHREWYRALFAPSVTAGILKPQDLAGYRNHPVYIQNSRHVPMPAEAVPYAMHAFFQLLENEPQASVRATLGHFIFVYIHPYGDGNGRLGRFLMNACFASGGFPWTIIKLARRPEYMASLEQASVNGDIKPFSDFLFSEMS